MTLALRYAVRSDVGLLREGNEDSAYAGPHLLAIADGMGGHVAGEVASSVTISALTGLDDEVPADHLLGALAAAVATASGTLHEMSVEDPSLEGMGTTLTALLWSGTTTAICHIGDSRAYRLRDGEFRQITRDHTLVQSLVDDGRLSPAQAATHPQRSLVMRALQSGTEAEPDFLPVVKLFTPDAGWTWYIIEWDGEDVCFGLVNGLEEELGYFSLSEIGRVRGGIGLPVERDLYFTPRPLADVKGRGR